MEPKSSVEFNLSAEKETFVYAQFIMTVLFYKFTSDIEIIEVLYHLMIRNSKFDYKYYYQY